MEESDERDMQAAELVLGLLSDAERRALLAEAAGDPALLGAITAWAVRLEPLAALAPAAAPRPGGWDRIATAIGAAPAPARPGARGWKIAALAGFAAAAGLAAVLIAGGRVQVNLAPAPPAPAPMRPALSPVAKPAAQVPVTTAPKPAPVKREPAPPPAAPAAPAPRAVALLAHGGAAPAMKALIGRGIVRVEMLRPVPLRAGQEMALWVWPRGEPAPLLLGALGADGGMLRFPYAVEDGTPIMITSERGGLPIAGLPGPTLLQGQVVLTE